MNWARPLTGREWALLIAGGLVVMVLTRPSPDEVMRDREVKEKEAANLLRAVCGFLPRGGTRIEATVDLEDWGPGTSLIEFHWDFGDGAQQVTRATRVGYREGARPMFFRQSESVAHAYGRPGGYTLKVRVVQGTRESSCEYPVTAKRRAAQQRDEADER